jgi:signal transduction histidine kinase/CheY-like chemotaxis protein
MPLELDTKRWLRHGIALLAVAAAGALTAGLRSYMAPTVFPLFLAAVALSAVYGGVGAAVLATALSLLASTWLHIDALAAPDTTWPTLWNLALFALAAMLITLLAAARTRALGVASTETASRDRAERERDELFLREQHARAAAQEAERRSAFLAEASGVLALSLDYNATLANVAHLAVPFLADWCSVDILETDGTVRRVSAAHADPAKAELAQAMAAYPPDPEARHPRTQVLRTGKSVLIREVTGAGLEQVSSTPEQLELMRAFGYTSAMMVALVARGQTLGVMTFAAAESGRHFGPADLALAEDLARRAALAVDNARLYGDAHEARLQAESASRAKDEFLATVSHELRTPLTPILAWARMLAKGGLDDEAERRGVEAIERSARSQAQLIEDLLDVSRITSGKLRLDLRPIEPLPVVESAIESMRSAAEAKGVRVDAALDARTGKVSGDPERLQQVVWNLLSNAIRFTPKGGRVEVRLARVDATLELVVSDTGKGISRVFLAHVFEPFRQADGSTTREHGGLGLGLAIVRHLIELHGGTVEADSAGAGEGASFTVRLPLLATRPEPVHRDRQRTPDSYPSLEGVRVLAVDDEPDTCELLRTLLARSGAEVRVAASAAEALATLEGWTPDILVSDIGMPGEDGYSLLRQVRAREQRTGTRLPAIALTAYARAEDRVRSLTAGFQMHLPKPIEPIELVTVIANLADK